jgi:UDPglucose 6-dehydrogenase
MKIGIIGTGYVGLPTGVGFAQLGHEVVCVDKIKEKIDDLKSGKLTIYEDGLQEMFIKNIQEGRLKFTTDMQAAVADADVVIIAVGTPPHPLTNEADLQYIYAAASELADYLTNYTVVATKSTVPVGTGDNIEQIIRQKNQTAHFDVISLPEFLREGFAIHDFFNPDRIVIGTNSDKALQIMKKLYQPFKDKTQMLYVSRRSSETIKYASNAFLAMKIHYINEMADFCEKAGADVREVACGMGLDSRIGKRFLNAGLGYGGSCFPKDTMAMAYMARSVGAPMELIETTISGNKKRKQKMAARILEAIKNMPNAKIAVWGLAFKNGTDDCRQSPAIEVVEELLKHNANITAFDPKAMKTAYQILGNKISYADDMYQAAKAADVLVILTEWMQFAEADLTRLAQLMKQRKIFDFRNLLNVEDVKKAGFEYQCIGRCINNENKGE